MRAFRVEYHAGRNQPYTVYGPNGLIWQFCQTQTDVDSYITLQRRGRR